MKTVDQIKQHLKESGVSIRWVVSKLGITYNHFLLVLKGERALSKSNLEKINQLWPGVTFPRKEELPK